MTIDELLRAAVQRGASDLIVRAGSPPLVRLHGELVALDSPPLTAEETRDLSWAGLTGEQRERFEADLEMDFAYALPDVARFRGNLYRQRGATQSVFRVIPHQIRSMEELRLPPVCKYFAERPHGLVLVSGPAASGKSTTLAAMVDYINRRFALHVTTIEEPIEFVHKGKEAVINQREIGLDSQTAAAALRSALRQDTNVIVIGELRGAEMIALALTAAETGHLVFATVPTGDAIQTLERLIDAFPAYQQSAVRMQLSVNLVGVVCQRLVKNKNGEGRTASFETLVGVPAIRSLIREGKTSQIHALIQGGFKQGMVTQDQSLAGLVNKGTISYEAGLEQAHNVTEYHFLCGESQPGAEALPSGHAVAVTPPGRPNERPTPPTP